MLEIPTYKGAVHPGQCDHMGHINVLWYTAKFDEASWSFLSMLGIHTRWPCIWMSQKMHSMP